MSAGIAVETAFDGAMLTSPVRSPSGIAFEVTDQFKSPERASAKTRARMRLEGYQGTSPPSTPLKESRQARATEEESLPRLLSKGRVAKLHMENEAKKQAAQRVGTEYAQRLRRLSVDLSEKANQAEEKRKEVLATNSQKAKKHNEAVEDKKKKSQEAEEQRKEELKAKLERKTGSKVSGKVDGQESPTGQKKFEPPARAAVEC